MDWKNMLCAKRMPLQNRNSDCDGYSKLAANIKSFVDRKLSFPAKCTTSLNDLKEDSDIASNLQKVKAKWHKRCALEI